MKVTMKSLLANVNGLTKPGETVELPDAEAQTYVKEGNAVAAAGDVETAAIDNTPERAAVTTPRRKGASA